MLDFCVDVELFGWKLVDDVVVPGPLNDRHIQYILDPVPLPPWADAAAVSCEGLLLDLAEYVSFFERKAVSADTTIAIPKATAAAAASDGMALDLEP